MGCLDSIILIFVDIFDFLIVVLNVFFDIFNIVSSLYVDCIGNFL